MMNGLFRCSPLVLVLVLCSCRSMRDSGAPTVGQSHGTSAPGDFFLVDRATGMTNGPFSSRPRAVLEIGGREYQYLRAHPLSGLESFVIPEIDIREADLRTALETAVAILRKNTDAPLPEIEVFQESSVESVHSLHLKQISFSDFVRYVCEVYDLSYSRQRSIVPHRPKDVIILRPAALPYAQVTRVYVMAPAVYDDIMELYPSFPAFLLGMGLIRDEGQAIVEFFPKRSRLLLHAPFGAHDVLPYLW